MQHSKLSPVINIAAITAVVAGVVAICAILATVTARPERQGVPSAKAAVAHQDVTGAVETRLDGDAADVWSHTAQATEDSCANCGVVEAVRALQPPSQAAGVGAVTGEVSGSTAGSQAGRGNSRTALGILGAVGGAYGGHAIPRYSLSQLSYRVSVRMEDGSKRTVYSAAAPEFVVGEKVRVVNGTLAGRG
jgi:outer membrane lipoprotein SlyB